MIASGGQDCHLPLLLVHLSAIPRDIPFRRRRTIYLDGQVNVPLGIAVDAEGNVPATEIIPI